MGAVLRNGFLAVNDLLKLRPELVVEIAPVTWSSLGGRQYRIETKVSPSGGRESGRNDVMIEVTLLGTGSPIPDARRAGPSTLVRAGGQTFLIDCGRGVQQRMTAAGTGANALTALLLTHLHSDHIADLGDVLITRWVTTFEPNPAPLPIIGPPGTAEVVEATLKAFRFDIGYRIAHHADLTSPPSVEVREFTDGMGWDRDGVTIRVASTDHRPVEPTIGFRIEQGGASVVLAGDTVPCDGLDTLATGAGGLVHTVIRKDLIAKMPMQRIRDISDYHSSVEQAAQTAARAGVGILILTHYVPGIEPGQEEDWRALAAAVFDRQIELGDDLHRVEIHPGVCTKPAS
jgi:ribonuclease Z